MTHLGLLKKRIAALNAAFSEYESNLSEPAEPSVDLKSLLNDLNLEELKEISSYVTELMLNKASGKKQERIGKRMPLAMKEKLVDKYLAEANVPQEVKDEYLAIAEKRARDRSDDEKKKFMDVRNKAQKWCQANCSENE